MSISLQSNPSSLTFTLPPSVIVDAGSGVVSQFGGNPLSAGSYTVKFALWNGGTDYSNLVEWDFVADGSHAYEIDYDTPTTPSGTLGRAWVSFNGGSFQHMTDASFNAYETGVFLDSTQAYDSVPVPTSVSNLFPPQTVDITASDSEAIPFTTGADQAWLSVAPFSNTTEATLTVSVDTTGLTPGVYSGNVQLTPSCCLQPNAGSIATSHVASGGSGYATGSAFSVDTSGLSSCDCAKALGTITGVDGSGAVTSYSLSYLGDCFIPTPVQDTFCTGSGDGTFTISIDSVNASGGCPDSVVNVPVSFTVPSPSSLSVMPSSLAYITHEWDFSPAIGDGQGNDGTDRSQILTVTANGSWTMTADQPWLLFNGVTSLTGSGNSTVSVAIRDSDQSTGQDFFPVSKYPQFHFVNGVYSATISVTNGSTTVQVGVTYTIGLV